MPAAPPPGPPSAPADAARRPRTRSPRLEPDVAGFDPDTARRVRLTVSCTDCDALPKVPDAGSVREHDGTRVQVMHNGVLVEAGGYFGPWMDEVIRCLRGHHEPQEELVYARVLERLAADAPGTPSAIELGAFWAYYSLWFLHELPAGRVVAMEPDLENLELGRRNFALNRRSGTFLPGVVGPEPGRTLTFRSELRDADYEVLQYDLAALMDAGDLDRVDLLLCDIQGGETLFFDQAADLLRAGRVRFAVVSTHHHSISGDPLTHQHLLERLRGLGAHVIAEHTVGESFSGDGLIAVSFDPRDHDLVVPTSLARQGESLFGALEHDLAAAQQEVGQLRAQLDAERAEAARLRAASADLQRELAAVNRTRLWRYARLPRRVYGAARRWRRSAPERR